MFCLENVLRDFWDALAIARDLTFEFSLPFETKLVF
jgi:hypothetical protein